MKRLLDPWVCCRDPSGPPCAFDHDQSVHPRLGTDPTRRSGPERKGDSVSFHEPPGSESLPRTLNERLGPSGLPLT